RPLPLKFSHTPSAGKGVPGERKVMRFLVPVIPEKWKNVPPSAVRPRIRTKVLPMYGEGGETSPDKDPSLRIASDLLLSLDAMKKRFP
ncbi:MAG: hypothetical protein J6331_10345, partial [Lentisphaeria bacterium]|nr:hypothetical protein [Lentisphaeria bacterium]